MSELERTPEGARKAIDDIIDTFIPEAAGDPELISLKEDLLGKFGELLDAEAGLQQAERDLRRLGG